MMYWVRGTGIDNDGTNGLIYLAIVEEINSETQIVTSESVTGGVPFKTVTRDIDNNWGMGVEYEFMGFIRNPLIKTGVY